MDVFAHQRDFHLARGVAHGIDHVFPFRQIGLGCAETQLFQHDVVQALGMQQHGYLVNIIHVHGRDHRRHRHIGEQRDLATFVIGQAPISAAQEHVRLNAN